jgi:hypothetical protein
MTITLPPDDNDAVLRHDTAIQWGWPCFFSGGLGCAVISYLLYWWVVNVSVGMVRFLADGFLCAPLCLVSCVGFVQIVSGTTFNRLHTVWRSLALWRRLLILSLFITTVLFLVPFTYFLLCLSPIPPVNGDI